MKKIKNFICIVDGYRRPSRQRNTRGRYRVGAKNKKEAKKLLQKAIGFGSIEVYFEDTNPKTCNLAKYKECFKEIVNLDGTISLQPVAHATDYLNRK